LRALAFDPNGVNSVRYRIDSGASWYTLAKVTNNPALWSGTFDSSGLVAGEHTIEVQAVGSSTKSDIITVYVEGQQPTNPPAAPSSLTATGISRSQINLLWADNSTDEQGFSIERCKGTTCTNFAQIATTGANNTSYLNTGLARNTAYRYRITAYNTAGNSGYSNTASGKTSK
jgi:titin